MNTPEYVTIVADRIVDMRRGLDYLETREDLDLSRLAYFKSSAGGYTLLPPVIDGRYRSVIFQGGGITKPEVDTHPDANHVDFVPLIKAPTYLIHGEWDECSPLETRAEPFRRLLRCPVECKYYEGGHYCPPKDLVPLVNAWLDKTLGAVAQSPVPQASSTDALQVVGIDN